jgi:hypothetical protein
VGGAINTVLLCSVMSLLQLVPGMCSSLVVSSCCVEAWSVSVCACVPLSLYLQCVAVKADPKAPLVWEPGNNRRAVVARAAAAAASASSLLPSTSGDDIDLVLGLVSVSEGGFRGGLRGGFLVLFEVGVKVCTRGRVGLLHMSWCTSLPVMPPIAVNTDHEELAESPAGTVDDTLS